MNFKYKIKAHDNYFSMSFDELDNVEGCKETLSEWLVADVQSSEFALKILEKVLNGECDEDDFGGNAFEVHVGKEFTKITFDFEKYSPLMKPCTVPTELLYEIVKVWLSERKKFYANK